MKGNNTLHLNKATVIAAVQMYFYALYREDMAPTVTGGKYDASATSFVVAVKDKPKDPA